MSDGQGEAREMINTAGKPEPHIMFSFVAQGAVAKQALACLTSIGILPALRILGEPPKGRRKAKAPDLADLERRVADLERRLAGG